MFIIGPDLPQNIFLLKAPAVSLNSSHVVIVGANVDYSGLFSYSNVNEFKDNYCLTLVYDFQLNIWMKWAKLPIAAQPGVYIGWYTIISSAIVFDDKYGNR